MSVLYYAGTRQRIPNNLPCGTYLHLEQSCLKIVQQITPQKKWMAMLQTLPQDIIKKNEGQQSETM